MAAYNIEIRTPTGEVVWKGWSDTQPVGIRYVGEVVFWRSADGEEWEEFLRGEYVERMERVTRFVPA